MSRTLLLLLAASSMMCAECVPVSGTQITAAAVAERFPELASLSPETVLALAPGAGARRFFTAGEWAMLLKQHGVVLEHPAAVCFAQQTQTLAAGEVLTAIRDALADQDAQVEVVEYSRLPLPPGKLRFERSGLLIPQSVTAATTVTWRGHLQSSDGHSYPFWTRVRMSAEHPLIIATTELTAGHKISADQVHISMQPEFPYAAESARTVEEVVGRVPRRTIRMGERLSLRTLEAARDVERGQKAQVEVLSGGAQLSFTAEAVTGARAGERILMRNPLNGKTFAAVVKEKDKVVVNARQNP